MCDGESQLLSLLLSAWRPGHLLYWIHMYTRWFARLQNIPDVGTPPPGDSTPTNNMIA